MLKAQSKLSNNHFRNTVNKPDLNVTYGSVEQKLPFFYLLTYLWCQKGFHTGEHKILEADYQRRHVHLVSSWQICTHAISSSVQQGLINILCVELQSSSTNTSINESIICLPCVIDLIEFNPENISVLLTLFSIHRFTSRANARHTKQQIKNC